MGNRKFFPIVCGCFSLLLKKNMPYSSVKYDGYDEDDSVVLIMC